jgi:hypothetical protein
MVDAEDDEGAPGAWYYVNPPERAVDVKALRHQRAKHVFDRGRAVPHVGLQKEVVSGVNLGRLPAAIFTGERSEAQEGQEELEQILA